MVVDTSTVRLVIFFGMFLAFAGDYSALVASIFGSNDDRTMRNTSLPEPQGPPKTGPQNTDSLGVEIDDKEEVDNGKKDPREHREMFDNRRDDATRRAKLMHTIKTACLPKLICELTSSPYQDQLSEMEKSLLNLIRDTSLSTMAEVASRYHFAAHMGQLIAGIEGQGCHNFYPTCPLPRSSVLNMMKKIRLR